MIALTIAYLIGSIPFGWIIPKAVRGLDIRKHGSGNPGATNVGRVMGRPWGLAVMLLDGLKGWIAVDIAVSRSTDPWLDVACALAAVSGHVWPVWIGFKGGKGVITSAGAFLRLAPGPIAGAAIVFGLVAGPTRMISAGSLAAAVTFPILTFGWTGPWNTAPLEIASLIAGGLVLVRHRSNIGRILEGTESRFGKRRRR